VVAGQHVRNDANLSVVLCVDLQLVGGINLVQGVQLYHLESLVIEVGAASSSMCLGSVVWHGSIWVLAYVSAGPTPWSAKVKSKSLACGGVMTMTLDGILGGGFFWMTCACLV
jgi:hypothetical protein